MGEAKQRAEEVAWIRAAARHMLIERAKRNIKARAKETGKPVVVLVDAEPPEAAMQVAIADVREVMAFMGMGQAN